MSGTLTVLSSHKDISAEWLQELLRQKLKSDIELLSWSSKVPAKKSGFLSEMCFVHVKFVRQPQGVEDSPEDRALVFKFAPKDPELMAIMRNGNLARREIEFYKFVATGDFQEFCERSGFKNPVPYVYWSDMEGDNLTLVMHDLMQDGYRVDTPPEGNSLEQVKITMKSIAVVHACGIAAIKKHGREYLEVPSGDFLDVYVVAGFERLREIYKGTKTLETLEKMASMREELIRTRHPLFDTQIHADLWSGNVMYSADDEHAVVIDWQGAAVDNPVCDILPMLFISAQSVVYEEHLNEILETYWQNLSEALRKNGIPLDKTFQDLVGAVEGMWMYGFMFFTASLPDNLDSNFMSLQRAKNVITFLERKGEFAKFLRLHCKVT